MEIRVRISGFKTVREALLKLKRKLQDLRDEFRQTGKLMLESVDRNFVTEGSYLGKPWQALAPSTVRDRAAQGFGASHPILQRTGRLRRGFKARIEKQSVYIENVIPYFSFHSLGRGVPKRTMMKFNEKIVRQIVTNLAENIFGNL